MVRWATSSDGSEQGARAVRLLRGFRSDELSRLRIEHITIETGCGTTLFLPRTKVDRAQLGTTFRAPAL